MSESVLKTLTLRLCTNTCTFRHLLLCFKSCYTPGREIEFCQCDRKPQCDFVRCLIPPPLGLCEALGFQDEEKKEKEPPPLPPGTCSFTDCCYRGQQHAEKEKHCLCQSSQTCSTVHCANPSPSDFCEYNKPNEDIPLPTSCTFKDCCYHGQQHDERDKYCSCQSSETCSTVLCAFPPPANVCDASNSQSKNNNNNNNNNSDSGAIPYPAAEPPQGVDGTAGGAG